MHAQLSNEISDKIKLWTSLLFHPRLAMRKLLESETAESAWNAWVSFTILLAVIILIIGLIPASIWPEKPPLSFKEWFWGISALVILNLSMFYFDSYVYWKTSLWLGGQCEKSQMRIVFTWTSIVAVIIFGLINTVLTFWLGKENILVELASNILALWSLIVSIGAIREATNLSIWRSGIVLITPYIIFAGGIFCISTVFWAIISVLR